MTRIASGRFAKALGLCLLIAGTLDISDALIFYGFRGVSPVRLLQNIASALLGPSAFHGGLATAALGLVIHYTITLFWAALFLFAGNHLAVTTPRATLTLALLLRRYAIRSGLVYGGIIYIVMNYIALPLTRVPPRSHHLPPAVLLNAVLALLLFIGLPIALIGRHFWMPRCTRE